MAIDRRDLLKLVAGGIAGYALGPLVAAASTQADEFFIFIHAAGGWDVTVWADPRNERKGLVEPASSGSVDISALKAWKSVALDGGTKSFEIITKGNLRLGPALGDLLDLADRLTIVNGIAMNTVSHEDGTVYSATGRHRTGGTLPESSIDVLVANELGLGQLMPDISIKFPSAFIGDRLDRRAVPLRVDSVDAITKSFARTADYLDPTDRSAIAGVLTEEATELGKRSTHPAPFVQLAGQHASMPTLLDGRFAQSFGEKQLQATYPQFNYKGRMHGPHAVDAAFAVEAMRQNVVRCVSFSLGGLDTHFGNYREHPATLQELFGVVAALVKQLDATPHPTRSSAKLSEHTHILVISEFCRTPQINPAGGRDHYPNNSALVISPRFRRGQVGHTDPEQLLPGQFGTFSDGKRPISPADLLATFLGAFAIDPRRYMRDGEVVKSLLA